MYGTFFIRRSSKRLTPEGMSGDNEKLTISHAHQALAVAHIRCKHACGVQSDSIKDSIDATVDEVQDSIHAVESEGGTGAAVYEFSTQAFFAGVGGACRLPCL